MPLDDSNLAVRAARLLAQRHGPHDSLGASLSITKSIPVAGGLAGGSANGAAALLACAALWDLDVGPEDLRGLAAELGSDVPFALIAAGQQTHVEDIVDEIAGKDLRRCHSVGQFTQESCWASRRADRWPVVEVVFVDSEVPIDCGESFALRGPRRSTAENGGFLGRRSLLPTTTVRA